MNEDGLLALYDHVINAPEAVERLRRFVSDLALRGRLVAQDLNDEPVSKLLIRNDEVRIGRLQEGRARKDLRSFRNSDKELPFQIPSSWAWVCLGQIVEYRAGRTPPRKESSFWNTGDYPWASIADLNDGECLVETKETVSKSARAQVFKSEPSAPGTIVMSFKLTIGKIARLGVHSFHNEAIISISPFVTEIDPYLFEILPDCARRGNSKAAVKGATLNRKSLAKILIPLPPLEEQRRILAKLKELKALCDQMESKIDDMNATRQHLLDVILQDAL